MTPEQRQALEETILADPARSLWSPSPGPQALAYHSQAKELLFGGAAGGGKTSLIVGLATTRHQRSLIIRRESTQLRGALDEIAKVIGTRDGLNRQDGQWRVPAGVALYPDQLIEFGGVPDPGSEEKHQGVAHDLLAFDEVTQISEYVVSYLSTWNRSADPQFAPRCRIVLATNPPTPSTLTTSRGQATGGGLWLIRRYAPWLDPQYRDPHKLGPAAPGELRWYVAIDGHEHEVADPIPFYHTPGANSRDPDHPTQGDGSDTQRCELIVPRSRTFIPSKVTDNPYLASTDYAATLQKLPEPLRSAMLYGDFSVSLSDQPMQLFPTEWVRAATARHLAAQSAHPHPTARPMTAIAADVSRSSSGDKTVLIKRYGDYYDHPVLVPSAQTLNGASAAAKLIEHRRDNARVVIDANGVGASVYDHLRNNTQIEDITGYVGSSRSLGRDRSGVYGFTNLRSEAYWRLRDALDPATPEQIALPPYDDLLQELLVLTWKEENGKIAVMRKDVVVKTLGRSPDTSDALVMAHWVKSDEEEDRQSDARATRLADADHNPFASFDGRRPRWSDQILHTPNRYLPPRGRRS